MITYLIGMLFGGKQRRTAQTPQTHELSQERAEREATYTKILKGGILGKINLEPTSEVLSERRGRLHTLVDKRDQEKRDQAGESSQIVI